MSPSDLEFAANQWGKPEVSQHDEWQRPQSQVDGSTSRHLIMTGESCNPMPVLPLACVPLNSEPALMSRYDPADDRVVEGVLSVVKPW